jgi:hypothetical protein
LWLEPVAPHLTSRQVLAEEDHVLAWAADAHTGEPDASPSVEVGGLDILQAAVAGAVAGRDRLVLVVGPAGTGKTTSLRAAVDDLTRQRRLVFGVAPSAKAARVLETGTGVRADTLAKLLHEWERRDRRPGPRYQLPAGATILVDSCRHRGYAEPSREPGCRGVSLLSGGAWGGCWVRHNPGVRERSL